MQTPIQISEAKFQKTFNNYIDKTFAGQVVTSKMLKKALNKLSEKHPVHKSYTNYLNTLCKSKAYARTYKVSDFSDRLIRRMKKHPLYETYPLKLKDFNPRWFHPYMVNAHLIVLV